MQIKYTNFNTHIKSEFLFLRIAGIGNRHDQDREILYAHLDVMCIHVYTRQFQYCIYVYQYTRQVYVLLVYQISPELYIRVSVYQASPELYIRVPVYQARPELSIQVYQASQELYIRVPVYQTCPENRTLVEAKPSVQLWAVSEVDREVKCHVPGDIGISWSCTKMYWLLILST